jgi:hypothetical protein
LKEKAFFPPKPEFQSPIIRESRIAALNLRSVILGYFIVRHKCCRHFFCESNAIPSFQIEESFGEHIKEDKTQINIGYAAVSSTKITVEEMHGNRIYIFETNCELIYLYRFSDDHKTLKLP